MASFADFQSAIFKALSGEPTVTAIVSTRIFDDVPHEAEPIATSFPRISIGDQSASWIGTDDSDIAEIEFTLHAWSRMPGRKECLDMIFAMVKALHKRTHLVANGVIVLLHYAGHETAKEADGETYHGQVRFTGLLQFS
jgi:hypothetical protein